MDIGWATIIGAIISAVASVGITLSTLDYSDKQADNLRKRISENKISEADIINLISRIQDKARVLSSTQGSKLQQRINRIVNSYSVSSGESEKVLRPIKNRLSKLSDEIERLQNSAQAHTTLSEQSMNSYMAMSDKEKARALKPTEFKTGRDIILAEKKQSLKNKQANGRLSEKEAKALERLEKAGVPDKYQQGSYTDTSAGRALQQAENEARLAAQDYQKIIDLSEQNM